MMKFFTTLFFLFLTSNALAQTAARYISEGNELYEKNKMAEAADAYEKAINSEHKYTALMNKGNALYKQKNYEEAIRIYSQVSHVTNIDAMLRSGAYYNTGVVYSSQKKIAESIEAYKNALRLNWEDINARENLQKALLELKQNSGGAQNQQQNQPQSKMSKSQTQQQLKMLEQKEKNTQQKLSGAKSKYDGDTGKDW